MIAADLTDPAMPIRVTQQTIGHFGRQDLLVNNAGATKRADFFSLTDKDWRDGFELKFHGYARMTRAAWPHLRETNGSIVNIGGYWLTRWISRMYYRRRRQRCAI